MEILVPKNVFLRVNDKFHPEYIHQDTNVKSHGTLVYLRLFRESLDTGQCCLAQKYLSAECKISVRSFQYAIKRLVALGYIAVQADPGGYNTYILLLSDYVLQRITTFDRASIRKAAAKPAPKAAKSEAVTPKPATYVPAAPEVATPETMTPIAAAPESTAPLQGLHTPPANSAYPSYNVYKSDKSDPLLPPSSATGHAPPDHGPDVLERGDHSSSCSCVNVAPSTSVGELLSTFDELWAAWPIKQDKKSSRNIYISLARKSQLPNISTLLTAVEVMQSQDARWQRGYAPNLSTWLRGHRWQDTPCTRTSTAQGDAALSSVPTPAQQSNVRRAAEAAQAQEHAKEEYTLPELPVHMLPDVNQLCAIWPNSTLRPVQIFFRMLCGQKQSLDMSKLLMAARRYLFETSTPCSLLVWLQDFVKNELCLWRLAV